MVTKDDEGGRGVSSAQRVPDTRPKPEVFFNTRSVPDFFSKSSGILGIGYFKKICFWHGKYHNGATKYWLISSYIIFIWPKWTVITSVYSGLISMEISSIPVSSLIFHGFSISYFGKSLKQDYQRWRNSTRVYGKNLFTRCQRKMLDFVLHAFGTKAVWPTQQWLNISLVCKLCKPVGNVLACGIQCG